MDAVRIGWRLYGIAGCFPDRQIFLGEVQPILRISF